MMTFGAALAFSLILLLLIQCWPQFTNYIILPSCVVVMIFAINLVVDLKTSYMTIRSIIYITLIVIAVLITISALRNCISTRLHAVFTKAATQVFSSHRSSFFYILLYLLFLSIFLHLVGF